MRMTVYLTGVYGCYTFWSGSSSGEFGMLRGIGVDVWNDMLRKK